MIPSYLIGSIYRTVMLTYNFLQDLRVGNKYRIGRKIGSGSFGDIYLGETRHFHIWTMLMCLSRHQHHLRRRNCHQIGERQGQAPSAGI